MKSHVVKGIFAIGFITVVMSGALGLISYNQWETRSSALVNVAGGGALCYPGRGDTIYALTGDGTQSFLGYSIDRDTWVTLANVTFPANLGGALSYPGSGDTVYAFVGGNQQSLYGYSLSRNAWGTHATPPAAVSSGGALAYPGSGDTIYALRGGTTKDFWGYSVSRDTWATRASVPVNVSGSGALCHPGSGDTIFATATVGFTNTFYGYSISRDTWTALASTPATLGAGAALVYPGHGDTLYALRGVDNGSNATTNFWAYSMTRNAWDTPTAVPGSVASGGALTSAFGFIYALRGNTTKDFYRYRPTATADTSLTVSEVVFEDSYATVNAPVATSDSFVQINFSQGGTTAGTLSSSANATGSGSNYQETTTLSNAADTVQIAIWTNQATARLFVGLRSDTGSLNGSALPSGISNDDTGRRAFGATVLLTEFANASGNLLGTVRTTTNIGDSFAYTLRYHLSAATVRNYRALGFDTAAGSTAFRFYYADTYAASWTVDNSVTIAVSAGATSGSLLITVTGLTKDLPGGLGGVPVPAIGAPGSSCVIASLHPPSVMLGWCRWLRDRLLGSALGRLLVSAYYAA